MFAPAPLRRPHSQSLADHGPVGVRPILAVQQRRTRFAGAARTLLARGLRPARDRLGATPLPWRQSPARGSPARPRGRRTLAVAREAKAWNCGRRAHTWPVERLDPPRGDRSALAESRAGRPTARPEAAIARPAKIGRVLRSSRTAFHERHARPPAQRRPSRGPRRLRSGLHRHPPEAPPRRHAADQPASAPAAQTEAGRFGQISYRHGPLILCPSAFSTSCGEGNEIAVATSQLASLRAGKVYPASIIGIAPGAIDSIFGPPSRRRTAPKG